MDDVPEILTDEVQRVPIDKVREHPSNPRDGDVGEIQRSIRENGFYGALVVQESSGKILAGNHRFLAAEAEGLDEIPVIYVDVGDEEALQILLADNRTSDIAGYHEDQLADLLQHLESTPDGLEGTGYMGDDLDDLLDDLGRIPGTDNSELSEKYTDKIETPTYEPTGRKPDVSDLYDDEKTSELIDEIEESDAPDAVKQFLRVAAWRHTKFDFEDIAEFYAHAESEVQRLMERSALVIIDFEDAIDEGYVQLTERIRSALEENDEYDVG